MLGDLELEQVQVVQADEDQLATRHPVPGLEGDFWQVLGRRGARFRLTGVLTAPDTVAHLGELRGRFYAGDPVPFVSDISTATLIDQVLIERMEVRELAGRPSAFEYAFVLREFLEAAAVDTEEVDIPPPELPDVETGKLSVTVVVEGEPGFDMDRVKVTAHGTEDASGAEVTRVLTNKTADNVWFEDPFPAGTFTVEALVDDTATSTGQREVLTGSATARVQNGPVTSVTIVLRRGARIGTVHTIHFQFDKAFVEPCMRHVLKGVVRYAADHPDERLLIVGHTDLVGSPTYNQALSERRGRATYAMLTFAAAPEAAIREWNELRRARPAGTIRTVNDTWGTREIQHMLQDLGRYAGNVGVQTGEDATLTDAAIRQFQRDHGLAEDGIVGDDTWPVLIEAYLGNEQLGLDPARLLANADQAGCDSGPLRWLGCSETDPVLNTEEAWRPNRRTELMFVHEPALPCQVPQPVTLDLVPDGAGGGGWCLNDGTATSVHCFVVPWGSACPTGPPDPHRPWCRQPAEVGSFEVKGRIHFEDGTPFTGTYVLIAPDGEYMNDEVRRTGSSGPPAGTAIPGRTGADGAFVHHQRPVTPPAGSAGQPPPTPGRKGPGTYSIAVDGPFVARERSQPLREAKGNAVCFRLDGGADADIVVVGRAVASIRPSITGPDAVVVRKPHTSPVRQQVVLRVAQAFTGTGTFTSSGGAVRFFDTPAGGNEITNTSGNVFTDAQLQAGVTLFAEGAHPSQATGDVTLSLALTVGGTPGLSTTRTMTSVELTLDIGLSRPAPGAQAPLMSAADKANPGRPLQAQDAGRSAERALLVVRPPQPAGFAGTLTVAPRDARVRLFTTEVPAAGDTPVVTPHQVPAATVPAGGLRLFAEGVTVSLAARDTGVLLGLAGVEPDGDHVNATVVSVEVAADAAVASPPLTAVQVGLWDNAFDPVTGGLRNGQAAAANFVDLDSRKFHLRVRDPRQATEVTAGWRTEFDNGASDDNRAAPRSDRISLSETGAGSGVFVSRAVMLVADQTDRDQRVNSGLPAGHADAGDRGFGDSNHRLRRITVDATHQLTSRIVVDYRAAAGVNPFAVRRPVFARTPEERRRIRVHLFNVRDRVGGAGVLTAARRTAVEGNIRAIHAVGGIYADIDVIELDPPAGTAGWRAAYPTDPLAADPSVEGFSFPGGVNLAPSATQTALVNAVRARPGFGADDINLVLVRHIYNTPVPAPPGPGLGESHGGEALPDAWLAAASTARSFVFVAVDGSNDLADPHEITHNTTDLRLAAIGAHFDLGAAGAAAPGPIDGKNLMQPYVLIIAGTSSSKRLWDRAFTNTVRVPNVVIPAQITAIRGSRFVHPY